jgi:hypothetical protein
MRTVGARGSRKHACAGGKPELYSGGSHSAGPRIHEQRFSRLYPGAVMESEVRGRVVADHGARLGRRNGSGDREETLGPNSDLLGESAPTRRRRDAIADRRGRDALTQGHDLARHLAAHRERQRRFDLIAAPALQDVGKAQTDRVNVEDDFSGAGRRRLSGLELHDVGRLAQRVRPPHPHGPAPSCSAERVTSTRSETTSSNLRRRSRIAIAWTVLGWVVVLGLATIAVITGVGHIGPGHCRLAQDAMVYPLTLAWWSWWWAY